MSGLSMLALDRHRRNGYSIESFVVNQRGSPVGIKKKIKKELIGTSDYPSNKIFTISNFITFTRLILTLVFLYLFVTDNNRVIAIVIYAVAASTDWMDGQIARMTKTVSWLGKVMDPICDRALLFTGKVVMLTGITLAIGVITWVFSPIKFQADMGLLLAFMFLWNMLGALIVLPALAHFLLKPAACREPDSVSSAAAVLP